MGGGPTSAPHPSSTVPAWGRGAVAQEIHSDGRSPLKVNDRRCKRRFWCEERCALRARHLELPEVALPVAKSRGLPAPGSD